MSESTIKQPDPNWPDQPASGLDEGRQVASDITRLGELAGELEDAAGAAGVAMPQLSRFASSLLAYALAMVDIDLPPWNTDRAGELLDEWRNQPAVVA